MIESATIPTRLKLSARVRKQALPHLHPDIRRHYESGSCSFHKAVSLHQNWSTRSGHPVHPIIKDVASSEEMQRIQQKIKQGKLPAYVFGMSLDSNRRLFAKKLALPGSAEINYINHTMGDLEPNGLIGKLEPREGLILSSNTDTRNQRVPLNVLRWFELLVRNNPPGGDELAQLRALGLAGQSHQGQRGSLGPWCERRFGLAAAQLQDAGLIKGFSICGEAGLPLVISQPTEIRSTLHKSINYASHEEAMAIDAMLKLKSATDSHEYALVQIKAQGSTGYDTQKVFIAFNQEQMKDMEKLNPDTSELFRKHDEVPGEYLLPVRRRVFKIPIAHKKMTKMGPSDKSDIVNTTIAVLDHMIERKEILVLDRPYSSLSFPERVAALIGQGFLNLDNSPRAQRRPLARIADSNS